MLEEEKNVTEEVRKVLEAETVETPPTEKPEEVASPEVKEESKVEEVKAVETPAEQIEEIEEKPAKEVDHINNLNIALKQEREERRKEREELTAKIEESKLVTEKLKSVFAPEEQPIVEEKNEEKQEGLTTDAFQKLYQEQREREIKAEKINQEVKDLENEWNGTEGKPKYDDEEVLKWQQDNDKLYLSPSVAFKEMKYNDILDYEVKKRLGSKAEVRNVETPGGTPAEREPVEKTPSDEVTLREAVKEAMASAEADINS